MCYYHNIIYTDHACDVTHTIFLYSSVSDGHTLQIQTIPALIVNHGSSRRQQVAPIVAAFVGHAIVAGLATHKYCNATSTPGSSRHQ